MNAITPVKQHPSAAGSLPSLVNAGGSFQALPKAAQTAVAKLLVAFPAGAQALSDGDAKLRVDLSAEAIEGFPVVIAITALRYLLFHNPRNPFSPTPQDIREVCEQDYASWASAVARYAKGDKWSVPAIREKITYTTPTGQKITAGYRVVRQYADCPPPWVDGCHLPPVTVRQMLRADDHWGLVKSRLLPDLRASTTESPATDEVFNRIPHDVFDPGEREEMVARRKSYEFDREAQRKWNDGYWERERARWTSPRAKLPVEVSKH